jgi:hypothetical protein
MFRVISVLQFCIPIVRIHYTSGEFFCFCSYIYLFFIFITLICVRGSDWTAQPITFMFGHMVGMDKAHCRYKCGQDWMGSNWPLVTKKSSNCHISLIIEPTELTLEHLDLCPEIGHPRSLKVTWGHQRSPMVICGKSCDRSRFEL